MAEDGDAACTNRLHLEALHRMQCVVQIQVHEVLQKSDGPHLTEESSQRILMKMRTKGARIEQNSPDPAHLQYHLPIQG